MFILLEISCPDQYLSDASQSFFADLPFEITPVLEVSFVLQSLFFSIPDSFQMSLNAVFNTVWERPEFDKTGYMYIS